MYHPRYINAEDVKCGNRIETHLLDPDKKEHLKITRARHLHDDLGYFTALAFEGHPGFELCLSRGIKVRLISG